MKYGDFKATVLEVNPMVAGHRPAIYTRLATTDKSVGTEGVVAHTVRLFSPTALDPVKAMTSQRIGLDELRNAFPAQLGALNDEDLVVKMLTETDSFNGLPATVGIEPQMKDGKPVKGTQGNEYYNIRLRSGQKNLAAELAREVTRRLFAGQNLPSMSAADIEDKDQE